MKKCWYNSDRLNSKPDSLAQHISKESEMNIRLEEAEYDARILRSIVHVVDEMLVKLSVSRDIIADIDIIQNVVSVLMEKADKVIEDIQRLKR